MSWTPPATTDPPPHTPEQPLAPEPPRPRMRRRLLLGGITFLVVAGAAGGGITAFRFLRGAGEQLATLAPDDTAVYVTVFLDPPGSQKLAVNGLLGRFPNVSTPAALDATVNRLLDSSLRGAGLTHSDVRPWLGSQLAELVSSHTDAGAAGPQMAAIAATTDEGRTSAAVQKYRSSPDGRAYSWSTQQHDGVTLTVGTRGFGSEAAVYAVTAGALVYSNSVAYADEIIDTAQGKRAAISSTADYSRALSQLPADKLALVYLDVPRLSTILTNSHSFPGLPPGLLSFHGYQGFGLALSAQSGGVALDGVFDFDASKLTPASRAAVQVHPDANRTLAFVPSRAYGVYALTGLPQLIRSVLQALSAEGQGGGGFAAAINPLLVHLSGDAAVEADAPADQPVPAGALLVATDSDASARQLISTGLDGICGAAGCDAAGTATQSYRGTTLTTLRLSAEVGFEGFAPTWAVQDGMAIIATGPDELKAILDARASTGVTSATRFQALMRNADPVNNTILYLDLGAIQSAVRSALPSDTRTAYDSSAGLYLRHFTGLVVTGVNGSDRTTLRAFIQVQ